MNKTTQKERVILKKQLLCGLAAFSLMAALPFLSVSGNISGLTDAAAKEVMLSQPPNITDRKGTSSESTAEAGDTMASSSEGTQDGSEPLASSPENTSDTSDKTLSAADAFITPLTDQEKGDGVFRILDTSTGEVVTVADKDFCYGAVAYEMPPSYEKEALKAQCVACYTHFSRWRVRQRQQPDPDLKGADFQADLSRGEYYLDDAFLRKKWGSLYDSCHQYLCEAVDECFGEVLREEDGSLLQVAYCALSSGTTERAEDIFGYASKHLQSVASPFDKAAPSYCTTVTHSCDELLKVLDGQNKTTLHQLGDCQRTQAGSILSLTVGEHTYTGEELRQKLGLRSANFTIKDTPEGWTLTVLGYGHGVGMSQYGANEMAKQGAGYREILCHYFSPVSG